MGAGGSSPSREPEADPWWQPLTAQQHGNADVLQTQEATTPWDPSTEPQWHERSAEAWMKQMQDMGRIIQHLASENRKLLASTQPAAGPEQRERAAPGSSSSSSSSTPAPASAEALDANMRAGKDQDSETLGAKVLEYERAIQRLEKAAAEHSTTVEELQASLRSAESLRHGAEQIAEELAAQLETLKQEHNISLQCNQALELELASERQQHQELLQENNRLLRELHRNQSEEGAASKSCEEAAAVSEGASALVGDPPKKNVLSPRAAAELENFQKQLQVKRDARHRALSAISAEMERLRRELNNEREARKNVVKQLENARNVSSVDQALAEVDHLKNKLCSEREERDRMSKEMVQMQRQGSEEVEQVLKELEKEKERAQHMLGENKVMKEQLEESDQMLQQRSEENNELQNKLVSDREKYQQQVLALKDVVALSKEMLEVRDNQVTHLKATLQDIEASVKKRENCPLTAELRVEYEVQMRNIKDLKQVYEKKMQMMEKEKEKFKAQEEELLQKIAEEKENSEQLSKKLQEKETVISERNETVSNLQDQLSEALDQSRDLSSELMLINNMFTQILSSDVDLDRLTKLLQENHELITEITTKGDSSEAAATLPKMLLDLVTNAQETQDDSADGSQESVSAESSSEASAEGGGGAGVSLGSQEIASHLPKVWRVLMELISHHVVPAEAVASDSKSSCYKSIDTPNGPRTVISVSQTFLRLRDLILQKKALHREVTRLKQLNVHLESKLGHQERRLSLVSSELRKTWSVVDRMRVQHQQLHTHEKVLRYELQQKRKMLTELKEELEYCREKWEEARQKNSQSEIEWQKLRQEFAMRKSNSYSPLSNSEESGFSDEKEDDACESTIAEPAIQFAPKDVETEESSHAHDTESSQVLDESDSCTSLPDLVSVGKDSEVPAQHSTLEGGNGSSEPLLEGFEECATVSLVTKLKQELSSFSRNLELITAGSDSDSVEFMRAVQSIFDLPAIQIPEHLHALSEDAQVNTQTDTSDSEEPGTCAGSLETMLCDQSESSGDSQSTDSMTEAAAGGRAQGPEADTDTDDETTQTCSEVVQNEADASPTGDTQSAEAAASTSVPESRAARMQRLERQCEELFQKVTQRSSQKHGASTSSEPQPSSSSANRSLEDILDARAARLKRLEEQSQQLFRKVTRTTHRRQELTSRLEELHEHYGSEESAAEAHAPPESAQARPATPSGAEQRTSPQPAGSRAIPSPPPLPANLPARRLPSESGDTPMQRDSPPTEPSQEDT